MSLATLNGQAVTFARVQIPAHGVWWAEVETDRADVLTGSVTLVLDDATFIGTILSSGLSQTRMRYRIAGGAGGWGRRIAAQAYTNDLGVKLAGVLGDVARDAGETLGTISSTATVGTGYVRASGPASQVLHDLVPRGWYVDSAGVTQVGTRAATAYTGGAPRTRTDLSQGVIELAPASLVGLLPGAVVDGLTAVDVEHVLDGTLRTTIWGAGIADSSRLPEALRRIVESITAGHRYFAPWEYRVVLRTGERYDLQAVRASSGMPDLRNVRVRPAAGCRTRPQLGSLVLVSFVDGDPSRPVVTSADDADAQGFIPSEVALMAGSTGTDPTEHATSAEALVAMTQAMLATVGALVTAAGNTAGAVMTTASGDAGMAAIVAAASAATLGVTTAGAISTAMTAKTPNTTGTAPRLGWPNVRGG